EDAMPRFCATGAVWAALILIPQPGIGGLLAGTIDHKNAPQHDAGAYKAKQQQARPTPHKGVIAPPPTGDEGIFTDAPNPNAGHEQEVIPPPDKPTEEPSSGSAIQRLL